VDLYSVLGVDRAASAGDIERAYRRLARRYHPGVNPGDRMAEELYRQVEHAYRVLGDQDRRREYDRGAGRTAVTHIEASIELEGFDFSAPAEGASAATFAELFSDVFRNAALEATSPTRGTDIDVTLPLSFRDAVVGGAFPLSVVRQERCAVCAGDGRVTRPPVVCPVCQGEGARRWARGHMVFTRACDQCGGVGHLGVQACRACAGVGVQPRSEVVTLTVPPGVNDGDRLAVPGRGHAGARGGPAGDLYVTIRVASHPFFRRNGRDLHLTLPLAVHEAALGARVDVPTLDEPVRLRVPPGTSSGRVFRIRGAGVPAAGGDEAAGDLVAVVEIVLPPVRDERSRDLLRRFGELNDVDVRRHLFEKGESSAPGAR
jgi:molecular chaperone DnaJ